MMQNSIIKILLTTSFLSLTACGGDNSNRYTDANGRIPLNNIQNPVVSVKAYLKDDAILSSVSSDRVLIDYKMLGVDGNETIATTLLFTPNTVAPKSGWPIVVWAHGTTGVADVCAPSQQGLQGTEYFIAQLLKAGYVVVAPDYEGLGSNGNHPFLNVKSEAFSITDAVVASRNYLNRIGKLTANQWLTIGHSQGGQAALGVAEYAERAQLNYKGSIAIAPASNLESIIMMGEKMVANATPDLKIETYKGLDTFTSLIVAGMQGHKKTVSYYDVFKSNLAAIAPKAETMCYDSLKTEIQSGMQQYVIKNNTLNGYGRLQDNYMENSVIKHFLAADSQPLTSKVKTPVVIYQGSLDTTVPKLATDSLVASAMAKGTQITYKTDKDDSAKWNHTSAYTLNFSSFMQDIKTLMPIQ